jgi:hypothetical protein
MVAVLIDGLRYGTDTNHRFSLRAPAKVPIIARQASPRYGAGS